jgi:hypothetical protein
MIRLDDLERHATAYLPDENRRAHPAHVQAYYGHCGPEAMLALIRVARMAKDMYAVGEERKYLHTKRWDEIKEALKEIEC